MDVLVGKVKVPLMTFIVVKSLISSITERLLQMMFKLTKQRHFELVAIGLASKGLEKFISNHVSKSMRRYGPIFSNFVTGLGNFFSIPFVLLFKSWFRETINTSHLDRYYLALAILSSVFLCIYLCVLPISAGMEDLLEDMESDDRGLEDVTLD
ncbi:hypothetical protein CFP56_002523 [Quercus suber]|uniref:Uncharacterized protein n=1 Tax=Quercus suber TaxID=58331 RepID=A0AAW0LFL9_QUESU